MKRAESGVALVIVLAFLVVLTLLGTASFQSATLGERTARNTADRVLALQAAESALRDAERDLEDLDAEDRPCAAPYCRPPEDRLTGAAPAGRTAFRADCLRGRCGFADGTGPAAPPWQDAALSARGVPLGRYTGAAAVTGVARQPVYWSEVFQRGDQLAIRNTAVGYGASVGADGAPTVQVILQAAFVPRIEPLR